MTEWIKQGNLTGPAGIQGPTGATGPAGPQGADSTVPGPPGPGMVFKGQVATVGDLPAGAAPGDAYTVESDGHMYVWDGDEWIDGGDVVGPPGAQGEPGPQGVPGPKGDTGTAGATGAQGDPGPTGPQGIPGVKGDTGTTGSQGPQGVPGAAGATGATGATGADGPAGAPGTTFTGDDPPASPIAGQLWWESDSGMLLIHYDSTWVAAAAGPMGPAGPAGAAGADGATVPPATVAPLAAATTAAVGVATKYAREDHVHPSQYLQNSVTFDPPSHATNVVGAIQTLTVTGAAVGDFCLASFSNDLNGMTLLAWVSAANTTKFQFQNKTAGTLDLASGTVRVRVWKQ